MSRTWPTRASEAAASGSSSETTCCAPSPACSQKNPDLSEDAPANAEKAGPVGPLGQERPLNRPLARFATAEGPYEHRRAKDRCRGEYADARRLVARMFDDGRQTYGHGRMRIALRREQGLRMSGKTVRKLMGELPIRPIQRRKGRRSSYKRQEQLPEPNPLRRDFESSEVREKPVGDATESRAAGRKACPLPPIDLFNGEIVGRSASTTPTAAFASKTLERAKEPVPSRVGPVAHADRGPQYRHRSCKNGLKETGAIQSMSRKADCQDDAPAESFSGHLRTESFHRNGFKTVGEFFEGLDRYIDRYNEDRIRCDFGGMSPVEYRKHHQAMG